MTLETLHKLRFYGPGAICLAAATPLVYFSVPETMRGSVLQWILPVIAGAIGLLYSGFHLRDWLWVEEKRHWVVEQIRQEFLKMIPDDLEVTPEERTKLAQEEIYKELTGVFWEAIDSYPELVAQKQFFYQNGFMYTGAIDLALILPVFATVYYAAFVFGFGKVHSFFATGCLFIALLASCFGVPNFRRRHLAFSSEQLDLIHRRRREFVEQRFREIITEWRQLAG
jgi:hypothetical protein